MTLMDRPEFQDFRVIQPKMLFSMSEMRISKTSISFNRACASELGYPEEVCLVASEEGDIIGLVNRDAYNMDGIRYFPFFDRNASPSKRITMKDTYATSSLRYSLGWNDSVTRKIYGKLDESRKMIIFFTREALLATEKRGKAGHRPSLASYPRVGDFLQRATPMRFCLPAPQD